MSAFPVLPLGRSCERSSVLAVLSVCMVACKCEYTQGSLSLSQSLKAVCGHGSHDPQDRVVFPWLIRKLTTTLRSSPEESTLCHN